MGSTLPRRCVLVLMFGAVLGMDGALAQEPSIMSPRIANYTIQARLDPVAKTLEGSEVLLWKNATTAPAKELWLHLYWNAWKNNQSTWLREDALRRPIPGRNRKQPDPGDWSYCEVKSLRLLPENATAIDLTNQKRFAAPDDGNAQDQTVLVVALPRAVGPKESIRVQVDWMSKIPRTFARTGFRGNFFFIAQWFPKVGVFQEDGTWNCHQFHAATEFFADYGVYDVQMTVPKGWLLGSTGTEVGVTNNPDGSATHRYKQEDVHDFAWTTSPDYREGRRRFRHPALKAVDMRLLYQPEHESQVDRHFRATEAALQYYGTWFGEYPYGHVTIIDPAYGSGAGGMEYPTLFTCGTSDFNPPGGGSPEGVTIHEAGHQFWYGIVGNNEFEDAWLDEGFNTFSTARVMEVAYGENSWVGRFFRGFIPVKLNELHIHRMTGGNRLDGYRPAARADFQATPTFRYHPSTASAVTYNKTALWLSMLEEMLGWETLQRILSTHFQRWKFRHPKPEDFFAIANEVSGRDLTPFFDEVHRRASVFDYSVESIASEEIRTRGWVDEGGRPVLAPDASGLAKLYETRVIVRRLQDGVLPVEVLMVFGNGEQVREVWDGKDVWRLYRVVKPTQLEFAAIDPERKILLDVNYTNNSMLRVPRSGFPATKWASKWMLWLQDYLQTLSFLI